VGLFVPRTVIASSKNESEEISMKFPEKLKRAVQYIAFKSDPFNLGDIRLNKILWKSDVFMHTEQGKSITGWRYMKYPHGPILDDYYTLLLEMEDEGTLLLAQAYKGNRKIHLIDAYAFEAYDVFSEKEVEVLDHFIDYVESKAAQEISDETHDLFYNMTGDREEISMGPVIVVPSDDAIMWAEQVLKEHVAVYP
jgi:hypothetical protein